MSPRLDVVAVVCLVLAGCSADARPEPAPAPAPASKRASSEAATAKAAAPKLSDAEIATLTARAEQSFAARDFATTVALAEQVLASRPDARAPLRLLSIASQGLALTTPRPENGPRLLKSAEAMRKLRKIYPDLDASETRDLAAILYNEACTFALQGESARALQSLNDAVDAGFRRPDYIDLDPDLNSLHKYPVFVALLRRLELQDAAEALAKRPEFAFDFHLNDLDGKPLSLSDLKGKVVLVEFWGTWSLPARKEIPHLVELARRHQSQGLAVVAVDYESEPGEATLKGLRTFATEVGITYPCLIGDDATRKQIPSFEGYPTALLIDRQGKPRLVVPGYQPLSTLDALVTTLLKEGEKDAAKKAVEKKP